MTTKQKNELIAAVTALLEKMIPVEDEPTTITVSRPALPKMLTKQDKVKYIRCGQGARGKILVSKDSLLKYLGAVCG